MNTLQNYPDVTYRKTFTINSLRNEVDDATTIKATATASYESFVAKQQLFNQMYLASQAVYQTKLNNYTKILNLKTTMASLIETIEISNGVAVDSDKAVKDMITTWQNVTDRTLKAADAIRITSEYVLQRKATNSLISNSLVTDVVKTAKLADAVVTKVITALTNALQALGVSQQSTGSTLLALDEVNKALSMITLKDVKEQDGEMTTTNPDADNLLNKHIPLENSLKKSTESARQKRDDLAAAVQDLNVQVAQAKEDMDQATSVLVTKQAALAAAEKAVSS